MEFPKAAEGDFAKLHLVIDNTFLHLLSGTAVRGRAGIAPTPRRTPPPGKRR
jgi:hypothetical protein